MTDFYPITDMTLISQLHERIASILEPPWHLRSIAVAQRGWTAIPVEKGRHVEPEAASRLAAAIRQEAPAPYYVVATEPTGDYPQGYQISASEKGLLTFSNECAGLNFILVPSNIAFGLLFTSEDYNVYAGSRQFVEMVLGTSIAEARLAFFEYANDPWWQGRLLEVGQKYETLG